MVTYTISKNISGEPYGVIRSDGVAIPPDDKNADYQEYLKWIEEGNYPADNKS